MTFFYDLNKKLDEIRATPSTTHGQLNERDMGKHNNGKTTGFKAVADKAAKEYGSKAAGERVAGAQFQKMKKSGQLEEEGFPRIQAGIQKYTKPGIEKLAKLGREGASKAKMDATRKEFNQYDNKEVDEGMGDMARKVGGMAKKVGGAVLDKLGHGSDEDMRKDLQRKMGMPQTGKKPQKKVNELSPDTIKSAASKRDSQTPDQMSQATHRKDPMVHATNRINMNKRPNGMEETEMTAKQKSFAALAPPKDKITFADKIAGAKKEVDEMLGDVAAEAMRGALSGGQKKLDKNKNGKLDAMDFEMLRKGVKEDDKEDLNPFTNYKKPRRDTPRVGDVEHGSKHDIKHTSTGRVVTRRTDDQGISVGSETDSEGNTIEKRGRGRPKGPEKAPERVTSKATKHKGGRKTNEGDLEMTDRGEYDQEGEMAKDGIKTIVRHAQALEKILGDNDNLPEWVQSKLAKIEGMMTAVDDYMQNQEDDEEMAVGEEKTSTRDNHAERAGRKVTKDIEYDEKKKDGIHGKKRGAEDAKAEKAGKKVAKDIEYDEKKKKVKEQGGADTPTASSGFSFGQGIYDSMNHELETMIRESMNISMNMNTDANGGPSKSVTVTATDDDAMKLGELLKNAGLGGDHGMGNTAEIEVHGAEDIADKIRQAMGDQGHGPVDEAYGDDVVSQNSPDFPSNTETNDDALQYSGGLNGPKSTGQTTIPVIASQDDRQKGYGDGFDEDSLARLREMAGIKEGKKPDFPDIDNDGDKKETIEKALDDKKAAGDKKVAESLMAELQRYKKA